MIRAASKPDSVHLARTSGSDHSSEQSTRDFIASSRTRTGRAARSIPYLILLRGGLAMRARSRVAPVVSCTAFSPLPPRGGGLFSVALSICGDCRRTPGLDDRVLCPAESGLSSPSRARPVTRADHRRNQRSRYRMRPHIVQATKSLLCCTSCSTNGGCFMWHPSHTPS